MAKVKSVRKPLKSVSKSTKSSNYSLKQLLPIIIIVGLFILIPIFIFFANNKFSTNSSAAYDSCQHFVNEANTAKRTVDVRQKALDNCQDKNTNCVREQNALATAKTNSQNADLSLIQCRQGEKPTPPQYAGECTTTANCPTDYICVIVAAENTKKCLYQGQTQDSQAQNRVVKYGCFTNGDTQLQSNQKCPPSSVCDQQATVPSSAQTGTTRIAGACKIVPSCDSVPAEQGKTVSCKTSCAVGNITQGYCENGSTVCCKESLTDYKNKDQFVPGSYEYTGPAAKPRSGNAASVKVE